LRAALTAADVLLTSTGARAIMVDHGDLEDVMADRGERSLLVVDIAMPRDVDPSAGELPGVTLLDMDDLRHFVDVGVHGRRLEADRAGEIIEDELVRYR